MLARGASTLAKKDVGDTDHRFREYDTKFKEALPVLHLATGIFFLILDARRQSGREVSIFELFHDYDTVGTILRIAAASASIIVQQWPARITEAEQVKIVFAAQAVSKNPVKGAPHFRYGSLRVLRRPRGRRSNRREPHGQSKAAKPTATRAQT